tara:strand:+ start:3746 stop:4051 length:306 start_codon:yes stop_codon:yes gene_type:complete
MIKTITEWDFINSFDEMNRSENFSVAGRKALFEMFEELSPDMELDPIAVCCDFSEYKDLEELKNDYSYDEDLEDDDDILNYYREQTMVLELANGGLVIQAY